MNDLPGAEPAADEPLIPVIPAKTIVDVVPTPTPRYVHEIASVDDDTPTESVRKLLNGPVEI
jgi:hypothetical protein